MVDTYSAGEIILRREWHEKIKYAEGKRYACRKYNLKENMEWVGERKL